MGQEIVELLNEKGARELRKDGTRGPEMSRLMRACIQEVRSVKNI